MLQQNREKVKLFVYFGVMLAAAGPLALTLGNAWSRANIPRGAIEALYPLANISLEQFSVAVFGLFVGLLILMTIDPKKRWQGVMLWAGLGVGLVGLRSIGLFLPNVNLVDSAPFLLLGIIGGAIAGGGYQLTKFQTSEPLEFRRASQLVFILFSTLTIVGLVEYHVDYATIIETTGEQVVIQTAAFQDPSLEFVGRNLFRNVAISGVFVVTLRQFMQYDAETNFFVLGPPGSGKSLFLIGAYLEALGQQTERDDLMTPMNPSDDLLSYVTQLDTETSSWIVEATQAGQIKELSFRYVHGTIFPKNIYLSSLDYAGEYLSRIPDALTGLLENENDQTLLSLARHVDGADTLVLIVDLERFENNEPLDIGPYVSILQATSDVDVLVVGTKADLLAERFREEEKLEAHRNYDDFKQFVNDRVKQKQQVQTLVQQTSGMEIYPVYYQTKEADVGNQRVPMRDETNSVMTVGFDRLLERLGR